MPFAASLGGGAPRSMKILEKRRSLAVEPLRALMKAKATHWTPPPPPPRMYVYIYISYTHMPFIMLGTLGTCSTMLGTGPLLGHALCNAWDRPALGTCPLQCLGQARSWDMPSTMPGAGPLLGQALKNACDKPALGTCPNF